jgi:hypothetical protein
MTMTDLEENRFVCLKVQEKITEDEFVKRYSPWPNELVALKDGHICSLPDGLYVEYVDSEELFYVGIKTLYGHHALMTV